MDLLLSPWPDIAAAAANAIQANDIEALRAVDAAVHHRLFNQIDAGDPHTRHQFALDMGDLTESLPPR
ncbi:MAG: hypothetical protein JNK48_22070, partial [Bryobacterales bacterium]|nr:hypothetical protein [Bryobacterales bacterium]